MLEMNVIQKVNHTEGEILSNIFTREKKEKGQYRLIVNLKTLNSIIPNKKFKMETLKNVKYLLQPGYLIIKIDLKHAYYPINIATESRNFLTFIWNGTLYEYTSLVFGLGPAPRIFTKLLRMPITILRKINIRIVIYIDDMLIMADSQHKIEQTRDTTLFLLQNIGFVINWEKSMLKPAKTIEFLGVQIDSVKMTLSIPEPKLNKLILVCQTAIQNPTYL